MPATTETPAVALSFANNFWGKDDAGVGPLLDRMQYAKQTCDELKSFYSARAALEDEYAKKLLSLSKKGLGTHETGTLKASMDTMRGEVEAIAKQHQSIAAQMKTELDEPLAAFAGGMKERRKIVQSGIEKILKTKVQQTHQVNKTRDKYEQECLKIKGYLAQGHMVMGQEERRNKAKLEKTQISLATSNQEYENAVKILEETTVRWNREWKAAADKFQDLEEERLDFTKSSLWTFANIASTVCVSDDASCEKIRLSLEQMEVEKDIATFISERGTGQEIPDAPKYINFCRGDVTDTQSETSEDDHYSVAQFPRSINPAFRSSSPQPSTFESHHDPNSNLANDFGHRDMAPASSREPTLTPQKMTPQPVRMEEMQQQPPHRTTHVPPQGQSPYDMISKPQQQPRRSMDQQPRGSMDQQPRGSMDDQYRSRGQQQQQQQPAPTPYDMLQNAPVANVPHDPYPLDGMTMLCRTGPPSDRGSQVTSARPSSRDSREDSHRDSHSDYSNPTSMSSVEPPSGKTSPVKQDREQSASPEKRVLKKKSGFFQNHSPFRRKSTKELNNPVEASRNNTWQQQQHQDQGGSPRRPQGYGRTASPEPIDANASLALGVGQNVLPVTTADSRQHGFQSHSQRAAEADPIAAALAELKEVNLGKQSSVRMSADRYHGLATPAPGANNSVAAAATRGTPPPYQNAAQVSRLGVPPPAVTSKAMKQASEKVAHQTRNVFGRSDRDGGMSPSGRPAPPRAYEVPRSASPAPSRGASPQPRMHDPRVGYRSASPNPYPQHHAPQQPRGGSDMGHYRHVSPRESIRGTSPASYREPSRPRSSYAGSEMAVQLAPAGDDMYGSQRGRDSRAMGLYEGGSRPRSKSVVDPSRQYTPDGRVIIHFARALYVYQAAIPEELGFNKGDVLAVLRHQDDGWWEAEVHNGNGRIGLVPSNYLQSC